MSETPQQIKENKKAANKVRKGLVKEPKRKYEHYIPDIGIVKSNEKNVDKVRNKYENRDTRRMKQWFETL